MLHCTACMPMTHGPCVMDVAPHKARSVCPMTCCGTLLMAVLMPGSRHRCAQAHTNTMSIQPATKATHTIPAVAMYTKASARQPPLPAATATVTKSLHSLSWSGLHTTHHQQHSNPSTSEARNPPCCQTWQGADDNPCLLQLVSPQAACAGLGHGIRPMQSPPAVVHWCLALDSICSCKPIRTLHVCTHKLHVDTHAGMHPNDTPPGMHSRHMSLLSLTDCSCDCQDRSNATQKHTHVPQLVPGQKRLWKHSSAELPRC